MQKTLSHEERLMVLVARTELGPGQEDAVESILNNGPDWSWVLVLSERLHIQSLLLKHLEGRRFIEHLPAPIHTALNTTATLSG